MKFQPFESYDFTNKNVLIREDFNVPLENGTITDKTRIIAAIPTIKKLLNDKAQIAIVSHLGRPKTGVVDETLSLQPIAICLEELLDFPVKLHKNNFCAKLSTQYITLFENIRFHSGETNNDIQLAKQMADVCDVFIMDAFAVAHRKHASTYALAKLAKKAVAGPLLLKEINSISKVTTNSKSPIVAIIGGAKISSKLPVLKSLAPLVDKLIIGGAMANTCLKALNFNIGKSLFEPSMIDDAKQLLEFYSDKIILPNDVVVAKNINCDAATTSIPIDSIAQDDLVADIAKQTITKYCQLISSSKTVLWNGPVGVFELPNFRNGTQKIAQAIANSSSYSLAGGGDTLSAIAMCNIKKNDISYIRTGGGAFLEFLINPNLPGVEYLERQ